MPYVDEVCKSCNGTGYVDTARKTKCMWCTGGRKRVLRNDPQQQQPNGGGVCLLVVLALIIIGVGVFLAI